MTSRKFVFGLMLLVCACFTACNWENPVMEKWWVDPEPGGPGESGEPEYVYVGLIKNIPVSQIVYETIIETVVEWKELPPADVLRGIEIIAIEYIIFSGDQFEYNENAGTASGSSLGAAEKTYNNTTIAAVAQALADNPDYFLMLHGHANPTTFTQGETLELMKLSLDRAESVGAELNRVLKTTRPTGGGSPPYPGGLPYPEKLSISGYGGGKVLFPDNNLYTALNRRVEMILFRFITTP